MEQSKINDIERELYQHEVQCEERWKTTFDRLGKLDNALLRLESRMMAVSGALILFLAGIIVTLATKL